MCPLIVSSITSYVICHLHTWWFLDNLGVQSLSLRLTGRAEASLVMCMNVYCRNYQLMVDGDVSPNSWQILHIDAEHTIKVIVDWVVELGTHSHLPIGFSLQKVKSAMKTIMSNNCFGFVDINFIQLLGTAMGVLGYWMWAVIYHGVHKITTPLASYFLKFISLT